MLARFSRRFVLALGLAGTATLGLPGLAVAQPASERTPNLEGAWVAPTGVLWFDFLHRFQLGPAPGYPVSNVPTFYLATGFLDRGALGALYSTEGGNTVPRASHELELFLKERFLDEGAGAPLGLAVKAAYNLAAGSPDAELSLNRHLGNLGLQLTGRFMNNFGGRGFARTCVGAGATFALTPYLSLAADIAQSPNVWLGPGPGGDLDLPAWGAGLQMAIPSTPHTLSLQVTNTGTDTIQGASTNTGALRYGFDFSIPFANGDRWLAIFRPAAAPEAEPSPDPRPPAGRSGVLTAPPRAQRMPLRATPPPAATRPNPLAAPRDDQPGPSASTGPRAAATAKPVAVTAWARRFFGARCIGCHGALGHGGFGPDLRRAKAKGDAAIANRLRNGSLRGMPSFGGELSAAQIAEMVELVKAIR